MEEIMNDFEPMEEGTKILIGLRKKSDNSMLAVPKELYSSYDMRNYYMDGIIIRNEDEEVDLLFSPTEQNAVFGEGLPDIPATDKRRKKAPANPSFTELDGEWCTQWQINNHPDCCTDGYAICEAIKYGWLPSNGEMYWALKNAAAFAEVAQICGADTLSGDAYWCSTQYDRDYMWSYNVIGGRFEFWHSKYTSMTIRPVKSAEDYEEVEEEE